MNKRGLIPILIRITLNGQRLSNGYAIGEWILPKDWSQALQVVKPSEPRAKFINAKIQQLRADIQNFAIGLELTKEPITLQKIVDKFFPAKSKQINAQKEFGIIQLIDLWWENNNDLPPRNQRLGIIAKGFIKEFYKCNDLIVSELKGEKLFDDLKFYLIKMKKYHQNYACRVLTQLKRILDFSVRKDFITKNPLANFKISKLRPREIISLSESELKKLENYRFFVPSLQKVADCFVFQCYTGLAYVDLANLKSTDIRTGIDSRLWLYIKRQKTGTPATLPLLNKPLEIIKKYGGVDKLPIISNQQYNKFLKEIAGILGIEKNLTTHVARKTFAMQALNIWNVPIESVSKMLGHSDIAITQSTYAQVSERKIANDMKNVIQDNSLIIKDLNELEIKKYSKK